MAPDSNTPPTVRGPLDAQPHGAEPHDTQPPGAEPRGAAGSQYADHEWHFPEPEAMTPSLQGPITSQRRRGGGGRWLGAVGVALILGGLAWGAGFLSALLLSPTPVDVPKDVAAPANFRLFNEAWRLVDREFYGTIPASGTIAQGAVDGLVDALDDPEVALIAPGAVATATLNFQPAFVPGMGTWIQPTSGGALVLAIVPETPADEIRLAPGDTIALVDELELGGLGRDAMVAFLEDPERAAQEARVRAHPASTPEPTPTTEPGSKDPNDPLTASLVVVPEAGPPYAVVITPTLVATPTVEFKTLEGGALYVRLPDIDAKVLKDLDAAIASALDHAPESMILDLRDNPGGAAADVLALAGRFLDGPVWVEVDKADAEVTREADADGARQLSLPKQLVVLVNAGTTGGAEMLAGALHDRAHARLVGDATAGSGTIQDLVPLSDGSLLRLTVAHWRTPAGVEVDVVGLKPDVEVKRTADDRAAGRDPQLDAAVTAALGGLIPAKQSTGG